jgi:hypothetical protein
MPESEAWREFPAPGGGKPIIVIGHSQGARGETGP